MKEFVGQHSHIPTREKEQSSNFDETIVTTTPTALM